MSDDAKSKTGKASTNTGSKPERRGKAARKPVTIDLEADKVSTKSAKTSDTKKDASAATDKIDDKAKADTAHPEAKKSGVPPVGRNAKSATVEKEAKDTASVTKTDTSKPDKAKPEALAAGDLKEGKAETSSTREKRGGGFGRLAAGITGGVIALGGAWALQWFGVLPVPSNRGADPVQVEQLASRNDELASRLTTLEGKITSPDRLSEEINTAIETKLAATGAQEQSAMVEELASTSRANGEAIAALKSETEDVGTVLAALREAISSGEAGENPALAVLTKRLERIDGELAGLSQTAGDALRARVAAVGETLSAQAVNLDNQAASLKALQEAVATLRTSSDDSVNGEQFNQAVAALEQKLQDLTLQDTSLREAVSGIQQRIEQGVDRQAAQTLAAAALKSRIDAGEAFGAEYGMLKSVSGDVSSLAALEPYAAGGIPTYAVLVAEFNAVADTILATEKGDAPQGTMDRLLSGARSLVKVRPIGPTEGAGTSAVVSRIRYALEQEQGDQALGEWQALPEEAKIVSKDWHDQLSARMVANSLMANAVQSFMVPPAADAGN